MRAPLRSVLATVCLACAAPASAQPTISNISPGYGGAGPNPPTTYTITGTGFVTTPKWTRFTDAAGADLFSNVDCSSGGGTTCTATGVRPYLQPAGVVSTIQIYARTNAGVSPPTGFIYYGAPTITNVSSNSGPVDAVTGFVISGAAFTSAANGLPGTTSIALGSTTTDLASGCPSPTSCNGSAPSLASDPFAPIGATVLEVRTPGGTARTSWTYGGFGATPYGAPLIAQLSVSTGPAGGGNAVTVHGTRFIQGAQQPIAGSGMSSGTFFNFVTPAGTFPATSVNCPTVDRCNLTVPAGVAGPAGIEAYVVCGGTCGGGPRPNVGLTSIVYRGLYAYAGIKLTPGALGPIVVSESGHQAIYKVSLYGAPSANVHVDITVDPGGATVSPSSLDFTPFNWAEPQTVTVTGLDQAGTGDTPFTIRNIASSIDPAYAGVEADQPGTNVDNDSKAYVVWPQYGVFTTRSGGTATFRMALTVPPTTHSGTPGEEVSDVNVTLTSNNPGAGTVTDVTTNPPPPTPAGLLNFSSEPGPFAWSVPRIVTITGQNDGTPGVRRDYSIVVTAGGDPFAAPGTGYDTIVPPDVHVVNIDAAAAPSGVTLTRTGTDRAIVSWTQNPASDFYRIKYSTMPGGAKTLVASSAMSGQTITGLTIGQRYYVVVSGVNEAGESPDSAEVNFLMYPPGPAGGFDGDSKSEMTVISNGKWKTLNSIGGYTTSTTFDFTFLGDLLIGDFDGDQRQDWAVYFGGPGEWRIQSSDPVSRSPTTLDLFWGGVGEAAVPGDYDGDGKADPATYRKSDGRWSILKSSTGYTASMVVNLGGPDYTPIGGQDFDGDFIADIAVYHQKSGMWFILTSSSHYTAAINKSWGGRGYTLVPADYDHDGKSDLGLYQRSTGNWYVLLSGAGYTTSLSRNWGGVNYMPVPGDYDGDGKSDFTVYDLATGTWYVLQSASGYTTSFSVVWGAGNDRPLSSALLFNTDDAARASDVDGDGKADFTVYNTTSGAWMSLTSSSNYTSGIDSSMGGTGNAATWGDYDGDGRADRTIFQDGYWAIQRASSNFTTLMFFGAPAANWIAVPGDFDGDGITDFMRYNPAGHPFTWAGTFSRGRFVTLQYGGPGYAPIAADFDGDGSTDYGVYQTSTGAWTIFGSSNVVGNRSVGGAGWIPVPADYDGDGKADFVVYNPTTGQWYGLKSESNYTTTLNVSWGGTGYTPLKGDFDGDGKADLALYQASTGTFYVLLSGANYTTTLSKALGGPGFIAVASYQ